MAHGDGLLLEFAKDCPQRLTQFVAGAVILAGRLGSCSTDSRSARSGSKSKPSPTITDTTSITTEFLPHRQKASSRRIG